MPVAQRGRHLVRSRTKQLLGFGCRQARQRTLNKPRRVDIYGMSVRWRQIVLFQKSRSMIIDRRIVSLYTIKIVFKPLVLKVINCCSGLLFIETTHKYVSCFIRKTYKHIPTIFLASFFHPGTSILIFVTKQF